MARPDTKRKKLAPINSPAGLTYAFSGANKEHQVPVGYSLDDDHEKALWDAVIGGRTYNGWRSVDLVMVVRYIKITSRLRKLETVMDKPDGMYYETDSGKLEVHPSVKAYKILLELKIRVEKSLQLNADGVDNRLATQLNLPSITDTVLEMQSEDGLLA